MAEYQTPEEFEKQLERMAEQLEQGWITAKEYNDAVKDARVGIRGYTAELKASQQKLGMSALALGKDMLAGKQGVSVFGDMAEAGAENVAKYTKKFGPAGEALGLFTQAVAKFALASLKQSDMLFESFQKISRTGTVGAGAMTEVFDNMVKFGYTVDQLGNLGDLLSRNSKDFGVFFSSALKGSRAFAEVADQVQNSGLRQQLFNLGMTVDDINDGIAGYINQQGKLGQAQGKTTEQLRIGAEAYIKELDILTKLTGMTRKEQEDAREQALQIREFYAGLQDLGPKEQEEALKTFSYFFAKGGQKAAAEMASQFNGYITGASDLFLMTGGKSMEAFSKQAFQSGQTFDQTIVKFRDGLSDSTLQVEKGLNQFGATLGSGNITLRELTMLKKGTDGFEAALANVTDEAYKALTGQDRATAAQSKTRDSQIKTAQNLQEFVQLGVAPATQALAFFTEALEYLTSWIPGAGAAKKAREEAAAIKRGEITTTQRMQAGGGTAAGMLNMGGGAELTPEEQKRFGVGATGAPVASKGNLRIKSPEAYSGGQTSEELIAVAQAIQDKLGGDLRHFSAFNDSYHRGPNSLHGQGRALDFTITDPTKSAEIANMVRNIPGVSKVIDEYLNPSGHATGKHIHAEISAANGAVLSGPISGYRPNLTMHGTEAIVPLNTPTAQAALSGGMDTSTMSQQLDKLDELIRVMQNQVAVSTKILQAAS